MSDLASFAIDLAEELFDQVDTPAELRDEPDFVIDLERVRDLANRGRND